MSDTTFGSGTFGASLEQTVAEGQARVAAGMAFSQAEALQVASQAQQLQALVGKMMRGVTYDDATMGAVQVDLAGNPIELTLDQVKAMTPDQVNANWVGITKLLEKMGAQ